MENRKKKPKNYLSIDGGLSGLPALYILDELFGRLQYDLGLDEETQPYKLFDIIAGTGTGGLDAILLGKLRFTVSQAIEAYIKLAPYLSVTPSQEEQTKKANSRRFEEVFRQVLADAGLSVDTPMLDKAETKTVVCALNTANLSTLYPIRSYRIRGAAPPPCTVLQAVCASVAFPDRFSPITLGSSHNKVVLIDAMSGYANPTQELLRESERALGRDAEVATIVSIGSGKGDILRISGDTSSQVMNDLLRKMVENCEQVHEVMHNRLRETAIYFRFNVERGLEGVTESISAHVSAYLQEGKVNDLLDDAINSLHKRPASISLKEINTVQVAEVLLKPRPSLVQNFVGRKEILESMRTTHFQTRPSNARTPVISILTGLGGSGKTQTALKFALDYESQNSDSPVYFVDASSEDRLRADLEMIIHSLGTAYRLKSYEDTLVYLATKAKHWLLIFDNADDPTLHLFHYIPKCGHGSVVITSRNTTYTALAPNNSYFLEGLSPSDAIALILMSSGYEDSETNKNFAHQVSNALGYLPLALAHAAGYILVHRCLGTYLSIYCESQAKFLASKHPELPQDYLSSIATTVQMSIDRLPEASRDVMRLFSYLHASSIAGGIISKAALGHFEHLPMSTGTALQPETVKHAAALMSIFCPSGEWQELDFKRIVALCTQYSLLQITVQGDVVFYSLHILVQTYLRSTPEFVRGCQPIQLGVRLLGSAVTLGEDYKFWDSNRLLVSHIKELEVEKVIEAAYHYGFGKVLYEARDIKLSLLHWDRCISTWKESLGENHPDTLLAQTSHAAAYSSLGRNQEALELEEQVLKVRRESLGVEDPQTLLTMANLAISYLGVGRIQEAQELAEQVLELRRKLLGPEHIDTMHAMTNLATIYSTAGLDTAATKLEEDVLEMRRRVLGPDHPDTLLAMNNLASSYSAMGRYEEGLKLEEEAVQIHRRLQGPEHPHALRAIGNLAVSYSQMGRQAEAEALGKEVLEIQLRLLGAEHIDTVLAMSNLAGIYAAMGKMEEALKLDEEALKIQTSLFGIEHHDTLRAMDGLATSLSTMGRNEEAISLGEQVVQIRRKLLGPEDPSTVLGIATLAGFYSAGGRKSEGLELDRQVLEMRQRLVGQDHPDMLLAMANLAEAYSGLEETEKAIQVRERLLEIQRRVLGVEVPETLLEMDRLAGLYSSVRRYQDALSLEEEILEIRTRLNGEEHSHTLTASRNLLRTLRSLGMDARFKALLQATLPLHEAVLGVNHPKTINLREQLDGLL